jgi:hypothetical protein
MLSFIRKRVTYANVAMTFALVFAMSGGAYAAKHYVIASTKQINPKVLKQLQGKTGPAGATGPAGTAGKEGPAGKAGTNGPNGTNGKSVVLAEVKPGETACKLLGGASFEAEGTGTRLFACNGAEGKAGAPGAPGENVMIKALAADNGSGKCEEGGAEFANKTGTAFACNGTGGSGGGGLPKTLPSGDTLTGTWATGSQGQVVETGPLESTTKEIEAEVNGVKEKVTVVTGVSAQQNDTRPISRVAISFPIDVEPAPKVLVQYLKGLAFGVQIENGKYHEEGGSLASPLWNEKCTGTFTAPTAAKGFLCVYIREGAGSVEGTSPAVSLLEEAHPFGVIIPFTVGEVGSHGPAAGSWAVTAE